MCNFGMADTTAETIKLWANKKERQQYGKATVTNGEVRVYTKRVPGFHAEFWLRAVLTIIARSDHSLSHRSSDDFANLFALIKTVEKLEKAFVTSAVSTSEYETACGELITKYKTLRTTLADLVPDISHFMATYNMHCASAKHRLNVGLPATIEHRVLTTKDGNGSSRESAVSVAECVHHYIGAMDTIKLGMIAKDQVAPCLSDLSTALYKVHQLPNGFPGKGMVRLWLDKVSIAYPK